MALPPFEIDTTHPADDDLVSQFPANERTHRDTLDSLIAEEHDIASGRHKFGVGSASARDAITDWVAGSTWINTDGAAPVLQYYDGTAWHDLGPNPNKLEQTGVLKAYLGTTAPSGYVMANGKTIGDASSGATERANADTEDLFKLLWNSLANTEAPVSGGRGADANADWTAHKTITLPDLRGRAIIGKDDMGGTAASRVTAAISGLDATKLGAAGGSQYLHAHAHAISDPGHVHGPGGGTGNFASGAASGGGSGLNNTVTGTSTATASAVTGITVQANGNGDSQNVPPSFVANVIIKL